MIDRLVTIVLAAGQGARLGGPKALLTVLRDGIEMPLVEAQCRSRLAAESACALAVVRADVAAIAGDRLREAGARAVISGAPDEQGPAGSIAAAASVVEGFRAAVVLPVDVPVEMATVLALVAALGVEGPEAPLAAVPRYEGRRGHPVVLRSAALARYREPGPPPLRDHLRSLGAAVVVVDVADPCIREDLDRADQSGLLARLTGRPGPPQFWGRPAALRGEAALD